MPKDKNKYLILTINPGSTSTKIGVFENEKSVFELTVRHSTKKLEEFDKIWDQYAFRKSEIITALKDNNIDISKLSAVVGRGGLIKPIPSGTYLIDEEMIDDARKGVQGHHASNLGCVIAYSIGWEYNIPAYIVDPPAVDDLEPLARVSGYAEIERNSLLHALNIFATARVFAKEKKKKFNELNLIVAHLGGGITVAALKNGKAINVNNGLDEGPFTPERSGRLPLIPFMKLCLSGKYTENELKKIVAGKGGLTSYFNTNKAHEVENMVKAGSEKFRLVYEAMAYQIAEEIAARAADLKGKVDGILLTGGVAHSEMLTNWIEERVSFISKVYRYPGELELEALAQGALRVLRGEEVAKPYSVKLKKVGIFYWESLELYVKAISIIEETFRENGFSFRTYDPNMTISYKNCFGSEENAHKAIDSFIEEGVDVIFAIGSPASVRAGQFMKNSKIPVICTGIYNPVVLGDIDWEKGSFYASCYAGNIEEQIEHTIVKLNNKVKKVGFMYKLGEIHSEIQHDEMKKYCAKNGIELFVFDVQSKDDFIKAHDYFTDYGVEWIVLGADIAMAHPNRKNLQLITSKIPTMCVIENTVVHGGLIGYQASWDTVCEEAGKLGVKLLSDVPVDVKVIKPENKELVVNRKTAEILDLYEKIKKTFENVKFV